MVTYFAEFQICSCVSHLTHSFSFCFQLANLFFFLNLLFFVCFVFCFPFTNHLPVTSLSIVYLFYMYLFYYYCLILIYHTSILFPFVVLHCDYLLFIMLPTSFHLLCSLCLFNLNDPIQTYIPRLNFDTASF